MTKLKRIVVACCVGLVLGCASTPQAADAEVLAFPGAEGAGRLSLGGRGGAVLKVTNLDDSGPGSLRAAVEADGPRTIVFDVGGTIALKSALRIRAGRVTIAGQTAPGGGITLRDHPLTIEADDVVVRFIRSRLGDVSGVETDAISVVRGRRIILDHVSASWSVDETLSAGSRFESPERALYDLTVQWSIISESLNQSRHAKGDHGYGSLVRGAYGGRMTFHHNLWANHRARMPRPGNYLGPDEDPIGPLIEFRSNVFYNWGGARAGYNADTATHIAYNFIDNAYVPGPDSTGQAAFAESNTLARAFFSGNIMDGVQPEDPWSLVRGVTGPEYKLAAPIDVAPVAPVSAAIAYERVLAQAGASRPRDAVDIRIVDGVRSRTGRIIDTPSAVGGWPALEPGAARTDTDHDGMPDDWERRNGFDPTRADDAADADGDGYTNLEHWLAALAAD
jgi:hypothetical protein